ITLLAGYTALLSRLCDATDVAVGTPLGNRDRPELEPLVGYVAHAVPLRTSLAGDPSFSELVQRVKQTVASAYAHPDLPYEHLAPPPRPGGRCRLFDAVFVLHSGISVEQELPGMTWRLWQVPDLPAQFGATLSNLSLMLGEEPDTFAGSLEYATELFDRVTALRIMGQFGGLMQDAMHQPESRISELRIGEDPPSPRPESGPAYERIRTWLGTPYDRLAR
ncbi:MAG TPA: condensation domain-containing protein, partial [Micromonosporaceae bacterium]